jgi:chorismate synthase
VIIVVAEEVLRVKPPSRVVAGAIAKQVLKDIKINAFIVSSVGEIFH